MRRATRRTQAALLLALLAVGASAAPASGVESGELERARAAANAGQFQVAIELYDDLLRAAPDDVELLNASAQLLSWSSLYAEAVARYDRVLQLDPRNAFAQLERAKVLSWSGRYDEAAEAFAGLLQGDPGDVEARLGLARSLAWSGRQDLARAEYRQVLAGRPGHPAALVGLAQTYAWSGQPDEARRLYREALQASPQSKDAELGLAYLDLWQGKLPGAQAIADSLWARHPGDREVLALRRALRQATTPWVAAGWDQMDDTDRNLMTGRRFEAAARLPSGVGIGLSYVDYDIRSAGERGSIDSLQVRADWSPASGHRIDAMLGFDRLARPGLPSSSVSDWGLSYRFPLVRDWSGWVGARREPYRYSVPLIDNRIVIDSVTLGASGSLADHWLLSVQASGWDLSDGNSRLAAETSAQRRWKFGAHNLQAGGVLRWLDWDQDLDNGYFDPDNFLAVGALARVYGPVISGGVLDYDVNLEAGLQSFDSSGVKTSGDPYYLAAVRLGWQLSAAARLEAFAEAGSYASEGSDDWRYTRAGARFVWQFGAQD